MRLKQELFLQASITMLENDIPNTITIVRTISDVKNILNIWRNDKLNVGLVPTMGALHEGHFSLIRKSLSLSDRTIVTLFVNPKQFGRNEDFDKYPTNELSDIKALENLSVDIIFAPSTEEMYPPGNITNILLSDIGDLLEGEFRPGFFNGVATVVCKLFMIASPDLAFFGEKDYQQLIIIEKMAQDLNIPVEIVGCPIIRSKDGLALSSRNIYLSDNERLVAPLLFKVLNEILDNARNGEQLVKILNNAKMKLLDSGFTKIDYLKICDDKNLKELGNFSPDARILGAAWLGNTRLIDNIGVN